MLVLFGLSRVGAYVLKKVENEEDAYFVVMLSIMTIAGVLTAAIQLPDIVGAFLAGLAVNAAARDAPASTKLQFLGKTLFIPIFFVVTGFLVYPITFVSGTVENFLLVASIVGALLVGKEIAARLAVGENANAIPGSAGHLGGQHGARTTGSCSPTRRWLSRVSRARFSRLLADLGGPLSRRPNRTLHDG